MGYLWAYRGVDVHALTSVSPTGREIGERLPRALE